MASRESSRLLVKIRPRDVALFRFILEAHDNLAYFTVLDRRICLLKLVFTPESGPSVLAVIEEMRFSLSISWREWPVPR